jgi:DNA-binding winged helix-turn-helix (wHTH) protein/Tfp pilus assembly protein PilF
VGPAVYTFSDFQLDASKKRLTRAGGPVALTEHQVDVLLHLVANAGEIVTKNALIDAAWSGVAVTDNSLEQAISALRKALGESRAATKLIETVPRRGYRFHGDVTRVDAKASDAELAAMLEPYRALVEGRAALETLERDEVMRAARAFEMAVARAPQYAPAHLGLAHACVMHFESTRADETPDAEALDRAGAHAREACRLDPQSGDAWSTLALVLHHSRVAVQAIAAARRAVMLEPENWRHHLRLAYVAWGEERLRAAQRTLALFPGFALAHWLTATVYVARQAFDLAERELRAGAAAQDAQEGVHAFSSVGLHWLLGLVHLGRRDDASALGAFRRELAFERSGQLFARECAANTWYAIGAIDLRQGRRAQAATAFQQVLERIPAHLLAMVALSIAQDTGARQAELDAAIHRRVDRLTAAGLVVDAAMGRAALAVAAGGPGDAASLLDHALSVAPGGNSGWLIPVDPLLNVLEHESAFSHVLARLRTRAA